MAAWIRRNKGHFFLSVFWIFSDLQLNNPKALNSYSTGCLVMSGGCLQSCQEAFHLRGLEVTCGYIVSREPSSSSTENGTDMKWTWASWQVECTCSQSKERSGTKHLLTQLICLSCSFGCVKFLCICEILVGLFVSVSAHHSKEALQNLFPPGEGREKGVCVWGAEGREGKGSYQWQNI